MSASIFSSCPALPSKAELTYAGQDEDGIWQAIRAGRETRGIPRPAVGAPGCLTTAVACHAVGAAVMAADADMLGYEDKALATGRLAGELAFSAGLTLDDLWVAWIPAASASWGAAVDAFCNTRDRSVPPV